VRRRSQALIVEGWGGSDTSRCAHRRSHLPNPATPFRLPPHRWRSNPSGKCLQERLTRGTVTSTMRRAAHPSGCARCGAGAGSSAIKYQPLVRHTAGYKRTIWPNLYDLPLPYPWAPRYVPMVLPTVGAMDYPLPGHSKSSFVGTSAKS